MEITLKAVLKDEKDILKNLIEKYEYEFSQYDLKEINKLGLYGYDYLDCYWTEKNRWPYFILVDGHLAGFTMVNDIPEAANVPTDYSLAEFFVIYKYRQKGVGKSAAIQTFDKFHGKWQLMKHPKNIKTIRFWDTVINEYTCGNYNLIKGYPDAKYFDGSNGDIYFFEN